MYVPLPPINRWIDLNNKVLENEKIGVHQPTGTPQHGMFKYNGRTIHARDMGGHETARRLWKDYAIGIDAVKFLMFKLVIINAIY